MACVGSNYAMPVHQKVRCFARFYIQAFVLLIRNAPKDQREGPQPFVFEIQSCGQDLGLVAHAELQAADRQCKGRGREAEINILGP